MTPSVILSTREISVERRGLGGEGQQVVGALALVVDLVLEAARGPRARARRSAPPSCSIASRARVTISVLALVRQLGIEHEQDFVVGHAPDTSFLRSRGGLAGKRRSGANDAMAWQEGAPV